MPFLAFLPSFFSIIEKFIGPAVQNSNVMGIVLDILQHSPTGASLVKALESKVGTLEDAKKREFTLEIDALLGSIQLDTITENKKGMSPRDFLFWGVDIAFLMSVLVEPTINYFMDMFGSGHIPAVFILSNSVVYILGGLATVHIVTGSFDKYNESQSDTQ